jgi:hypothetical protein
VRRPLPTWALAFTLGASCTAGRNPILIVPPAPPPWLTLSGVIWSEVYSTPLSGAKILLHDLAVKDTALEPWKLTTEVVGSFLFDSLLPGHYAVETRAIGYKRRVDTLFLHAAPGLFLRIPMVGDSLCLGDCPANPLVLAAAWARRDRWVCDRDQKSIAHARALWIDFFSHRAQPDPIGPLLNPSMVGKRLLHVGDDSLCRRVAQAHGPASALAFTVFRLDNFWLISEPNFSSPWVLDAAFKDIAYAGRRLP